MTAFVEPMVTHTTAAVNNLLFKEIIHESILVNKTVHLTLYLLLIICFTDDDKVAKSLFLSFPLRNLLC